MRQRVEETAGRETTETGDSAETVRRRTKGTFRRQCGQHAEEKFERERDRDRDGGDRGDRRQSGDSVDGE